MPSDYLCIIVVTQSILTLKMLPYVPHVNCMAILASNARFRNLIIDYLVLLVCIFNDLSLYEKKKTNLHLSMTLFNENPLRSAATGEPSLNESYEDSNGTFSAAVIVSAAHYGTKLLTSLRTLHYESFDRKLNLTYNFAPLHRFIPADADCHCSFGHWGAFVHVSDRLNRDGKKILNMVQNNDAPQKRWPNNVSIARGNGSYRHSCVILGW